MKFRKLLLFVSLCLFAATSTAAPTLDDFGFRALETDSLEPDTMPEDLIPDEEENVPTISIVPTDSTTATIIHRLTELTHESLFDHTQLGLYVYDLTADAPIFALGQHQRLRPASNEKLVTAISALFRLGTDYHYRTRLYIDGEQTDSVLHGNVYLRGGFDPMVDDDDVRALSRALAERGIRYIDGAVTFDDTMKDNDRLGWGWCWDDDEGPLTPLLFKSHATLEDHFLTALQRDSISYRVRRSGATPTSAKLVCERLRSIDAILLPMMKKSDNLYAESVFYQLAAHSGHARAGRKRATQEIQSLLTSFGLSTRDYQIADGSGLSLYNYTTPYVLVTLLRHAYADERVRAHLIPSLPIAGEDGTLRRRMRTSAARGNVKAKTGTVEGVSTLSGYCTAANGHVLCFSIMNQGIRRAAIGRNFQDRVCAVLVGE